MASFNEIAKIIQEKEKRIITEALTNKVRLDIADLIQKYLLDEIYSKYQPQQYERSYTLLTALEVGKVIVSGDKISVKIFIPNTVISSEEYKMWVDEPSLGLSKGESPTISQIAKRFNENLNPYRDNDTAFLNMAIEEIKTTNIIIEGFITYLKSKGINTI